MKPDIKTTYRWFVSLRWKFAPFRGQKASYSVHLQCCTFYNKRVTVQDNRQQCWKVLVVNGNKKIPQLNPPYAPFSSKNPGRTIFVMFQIWGLFTLMGHLKVIILSLSGHAQLWEKSAAKATKLSHPMPSLLHTLMPPSLPHASTSHSSSHYQNSQNYCTATNRRLFKLCDMSPEL